MMTYARSRRESTTSVLWCHEATVKPTPYVQPLELTSPYEAMRLETVRYMGGARAG
jgi:hypothetical protein